MNRHLTNPWHPWHRRPACEDHRRDAGATIAAATNRAGLTLIELLVVITIIVILVAGSLPTLIPALEQRRTREAARLLHTALGRARNQAIANGRPAGVLIQRMRRPGLTTGSVLVFQAEVPPPYAGDTIDAKVWLIAQGGSGGSVMLTASEDLDAPGTFSDGLVRIGDRVQFNYQGPLYEIMGGASGGEEGFVTLPLTLKAQIGKGEVPWSDISYTVVSYQIFRQPVKTAAEPALLPAGTVIDLGQSKEGNGPLLRVGAGSNARFPIILTFASDGSLDRIYHSGGRGVKPRSALHLLIGKIDKLGNANPQTLSNLQDLTNLWVTVGRQTGLVTTSKLSKDDPLKFARESQSEGGL